MRVAVLAAFLGTLPTATGPITAVPTTAMPTTAMPTTAMPEWPPETLVNIQALPEDVTVRQVRTLMRSFAGALGVRCTHCHVGDDPDDLNSMDFVSDAKLEKRKAREMIRMVRRINEELLAGLPGRSEPPIEVSCRTCHHSVALPVDIRDLIVRELRADGVDAAFALYQELRARHLGSDSYDFRHFVLANVAERVADDMPEAAIRLLELNGELHPESGQTFATMARIQRDQGDLGAAIRAMEQALEAEPESAFYRQILRQLEAEREP